MDTKQKSNRSTRLPAGGEAMRESTIYAKLYGSGFCTLASNGPQHYLSVVREALTACTRIEITFDRERFEQMLLAQGIPPDVVRTFVDSAIVVEDRLKPSQGDGNGHG
jgi:hypothetical protein